MRTAAKEEVRSDYLKILHHRDKETECERERLSWLQSEVQMAVRFTQSTRLTRDGITPLFSFTHGFAWPLLFLCETILAKSSSVLDNILLTRIVIKTGQTGQSSGSPTLHRPAPGHTTWGAFIFLGGGGRIGGGIVSSERSKYIIWVTL